MLIPLIARHADRAEREHARYVAWQTALRRLHEDWQAGHRVPPDRLHGYLDGVPESQRSEALADLCAEHLRLSWAHGTGLRLAAYRLGALSADLLEDEFLARQQIPYGDAPAAEDYGDPAVVRLLQRHVVGAGRYVKLRRLGRGAVGEVFAARDRRLSRLVAVKIAHAEPAALARFATEVRVTAALDHPSIVKVYEAFAADGRAGCAMQLVPGRTLAQRIQDGVPLPDLLRCLAAACDGVAHAHARGVLHRDLKPGNVLVGDSGETVVIDWGPDVDGTPEYMAPEQLHGDAEPRSDVYGLGATLYEIATGRPPCPWLPARRPCDWRRQLEHAATPALRGIARPLRRILAKALAHHPADRHGDVRELAHEIRACRAATGRRGRQRWHDESTIPSPRDS